MWSWLDTPQCAVVLYALAGTIAIVTGVVEQRRNRDADQRLWPTFWFATGALLVVMAVGRASDVSELLTDLGREQARSGGWYEVRRSFQAWLIGAVAVVWTVTVVVAVWRVPVRRRRYLPIAVVVLTLVCFVGVRLISLHQVDALLRNRNLRGITVGAAIEVGLLLLIIAVSVWRFPRSSSMRPDVHTGPHVGSDAQPAFEDEGRRPSGQGRPLGGFGT